MTVDPITGLPVDEPVVPAPPLAAPVLTADFAPPSAIPAPPIAGGPGPAAFDVPREAPLPPVASALTPEQWAAQSGNNAAAQALQVEAGTPPTSPGQAASAPGSPAVSPPLPAARPGLEFAGTTDKQTSKVQTAAEKAAIKEQGGLNTEAQAQLTGPQAAAEKRNREQELAAQVDANKQLAATEAAHAALVAQQQATTKRLNDYAATKSKEYADSKFSDFWASKSTGAQILATVLSGIGQVAARTTGGKNLVLDALGGMIDQDFARQKADMAHRKDIMELARTDAGAAEEKLRHLGLELQIKKVGVLEKLARIRQEDLARNGVADAAMAGDAKLLALKQKQNAETIDLQKGLRGEAERTRVMAPTAPVAGVDPKRTVMGPGGKPIGLATTEKEASDTNKALEGYTNFANSAAEMRKMISQGGSAMSGKRRGQLEALQTSLTFAVKNMEQGGALDKGLVETVTGLIPDATGWTGTMTSSANMLAKLDKATEIARNKARARLDAAGVGGHALDVVDRARAAGAGR